MFFISVFSYSQGNSFENAKNYLNSVDSLNQKSAFIQMRTDQMNRMASSVEGKKNIEKMIDEISGILKEMENLTPPPELKSYNQKALAYLNYTITYYKSIDRYRELFPLWIQKGKEALEERKKALKAYADVPQENIERIDDEINQINNILRSKGY